MGGLGQTFAAGGSTVLGTAFVIYLAQWLHMPPMTQEVAGAFALLLSGGVHALAIVIQKKWGVDIEAAPAPAVPATNEVKHD